MTATASTDTLRNQTNEPRCPTCGSSDLDVYRWEQDGQSMMSVRCGQCDYAQTHRIR